MTRAKRYLIGSAAALALALGAAAFGLTHATPPPVPALEGDLAETRVTVAGKGRSYLSYVPKNLTGSPALVLAFHGGRGDANELRIQTAYELDELADRRGFIVVYPNGWEHQWNTCQKGRREAATTLGVDDVAFARAIVARFRAERGAGDVFAFGYSNGGHMAMRLGLEMPEDVRAVAAIAANMPEARDDKCAPAPGRAAASLLLVNGTADPVNPFDGGELSFHGIHRMGPVRSTARTAEYFRSLGAPEVSVLTVGGGGHSIPQRRYRFPKMFGATNVELDAPSEAVSFFERHPSLGSHARL